MRKTVLASLGLLLSASSLVAQSANDPTKTVSTTNVLAPGWMMRFDPLRAGQTPKAIKLEAAGGGIHITSGSAALYYRAADVATGNYTASATFSQTRSMQHEAYGLFVGGANLQDSTQKYLYYVVRPAMPENVLINYRGSDAKPRTIVAYMPAAQVNNDSPTDGSAKNMLAIKVGKDSVWFMANGKSVKALPKSELAGISTDGIVGVRVNHNSELQIDGLAIKKDK